MRVLMLAQFYPPVVGGEERHVLSLSEGLVRRGHEVVVATMPHPSRPEKTELGGVAVQSVHGALQRVSSLFSERERPHAPPFRTLSFAGALRTSSGLFSLMSFMATIG